MIVLQRGNGHKDSPPLVSTYRRPLRNPCLANYLHLSKSINCRLMDIALDGTAWCMGSATPNLVRLEVKD